MSRSLATCLYVRIMARPLTTARALLRGLGEPNCLAKQFLYPASSSTVRHDPPAMTPVPGPAGRSITTAPPDPLTVTRWGNDCPLASGTSTRHLRASAAALVTATCTSRALEQPTPTLPFPSPTTTVARKLMLFPPLVTLVTRWTCTTVSSRPSPSSFPRPRPPRPRPPPRAPPPLPRDLTGAASSSSSSPKSADSAGAAASGLAASSAARTTRRCARCETAMRTVALELELEPAT
mmetsp:Transcript_20291/g.32878  ORF Transcript_20291/g.32878 Transcript_20291/m.32878 type:complete len:236 (-) Transcript_20291:185-892(-)